MKRYFDMNDDLARIVRIGWDAFPWVNPSYTYLNGEFVDTEKFDIIPKKSYQEQQLKFKEQKLQELKERRKNDNLLFDEQEKALKLEIDTLRQKIKAL
jgi:hypothetical protein